MNATHPVSPEDVMAYLDGEVAPDTARDIESHVAGCGVCQQLADDLRESSTRMRKWHVGEPSHTLVAPQPRRPRSAERAIWSTWGSRAWTFIAHRPGLAIAGSGVVVVILAIPLFQSTSKPPAVRASLEMPETIADFAAATAAPMELRPGLQGQQGQNGVRRMAGSSAEPAAQAESGPRIVRTATLRVVAGDFERIRPAVDRILEKVGGFLGEITASDRPGAPRSIRGTLRIPNAQFDTALAELRGLGRVTEESRNAEDVTTTSIDLDVRLANARVTEKRLTEVLQNRTGRVADILEVEREIARVRTEIEQLDAARTQLARRVEYATVSLEVVEERAAAVNLGPVPITTRLGHAITDGLESAAMSMLDATLFVLRAGPVLLLWTIVVGLPAWWLIRVRRVRDVH